MAELRKILCYSIFLLVSDYCFTQALRSSAPKDYNAVNWNTEQGYPHKRTNSFLKDINGFLWIGAETGLSRFDGSIFKNYFSPAGKAKNIPTGIIKGLTEDSLHNIWIGSDKGLWLYNNLADSFTHFLPYGITENADTYIIPFWATKDEVLCVEADTMITAYNSHSFTKRRLVYLSKKIIDNDPVQFSVFDQATNSIWMLQGSAGFFQVSLHDGSMESYGCAGSEGMCFDRKRHAIWLNSPDGLMRFDLNNKKVQHTDDVNRVFSRGVAIHTDPFYRIWVCTLNDLFIYDPDSHSIDTPFPENKNLNKNICWANYRMYCDHDGIVWIGYYTEFGKGVTQLTPVLAAVTHYNNKTGNPNSLNLDWSNTIRKTSDGKIWLGGDRRLNVLDPVSGRFRQIEASQFSGIEKTSEHITFIGSDSEARKVWLYTARPDLLYEAEISNHQFRQVTVQDTTGKILNEISPDDYVLRQFKNGWIFLSRNHDELTYSVFLIGNEPGVCKQLLSLKNEKITNLATDGEKLIFVRIEGSLVNKTYLLENNKWKQIGTPFDSIPWIEIRYNKPDQSWWVGGYMLMAHYDKNFHRVKHYTQDDGVIDTEVYGIMPDKQGNIWFNGSSGYISQINDHIGTITTLTEKDGCQKQAYFHLPGVTKDDNGDIYFIGYEGIDRISPDKYLFQPSYAYLKSVSIKDFTLPMDKGVNKLEELSLRYFQNRINIETGTIDYYSKGKSHIRYKLESKSREEPWQNAPSNYTIRYEELPPGKYKLLIQAANAGNEFTGPVKMILFAIAPAFWNTWWFRTVALLFFTDLVYTFIQWRTKQKFKLQLERSKKEKELSEIKQKATELEMQALRAQMNPHFIFNSLNSINRFILQNNRTQASEYLTKFSKLVRLILQNSQASLISLESELEALNLYLDLESLRFDYHFGYKISVPKDLDIEVLKVPPLIIQPYTENAIWHGLMHKTDKGQLDIEVSQEGDYLYFKITDNGIGRKKAAELSGRSATTHKSMGLRITRDRIAMLHKSNGSESPVKIIDLANPDGSAAGTEVIIKMPVIE